MREIIDFHNHPGYNTTKQFGYDLTPEMFVDDAKRAGITKTCGCALDLELIRESCSDFNIIKSLNEVAWHWHELFPDFIVPGIHIHPNFPEESAVELENYRKKGVRLVGELVPYLMGHDSTYIGSTYLLDGYYELFDLCMKKNMVVSIHRPSNIDECGVLAKRFKSLQIVVAHPGYNEDYFNILEAVKKYDNLYLDLSGTGIAENGMLKYGVDTIGSNKMVFGTDGYNPEMYVHAVLFEKLTDEEKENIFYKNAERILFDN